MITCQRKKILFACYGGGHVQSLIPVILKLQKEDIHSLEVIGFTTAKHTCIEHGIDALGYEVFLNDDAREHEELARQLLPTELHSRVSLEESVAYHAVGISELIQKYGRERALEIFSTEGRSSFLPISTFSHYLTASKPDLIVTTSSPRSERAMLLAGEELGITTLCVSDLFLQHESEYICTEQYANNISVMSGYTASFLKDEGYVGNIYITGNPAFDSLYNIQTSEGPELRRRLGIPQVNHVVLWVCPSSSRTLTGKKFANTNKVLAYLEEFVHQHPNVSVLIREHPSKSVIDRTLQNKTIICPREISIEQCLSAADVVLLETSTVGLQAALLGIPVVTMNIGEYPPYAQLGLSFDVQNIKDVGDALLNPIPPVQTTLAYPKVGTATQNVVEVIENLLQPKVKS